MNINCIICSDLFSYTSEIYSTTCGHIFHYVCLVQWIERSKTCPQCRQKATEKTIHRVYFNIQSTEGVTEDIGTLQSRVDSLNFQLKVKDKDIKLHVDKYKTYKTQNATLRDEVRSLENKQKVHESTQYALKEQITYFKQKAKEMERLGDETKKLKSRLKTFESLDVVMKGSLDQVNTMLHHNQDVESLSLLVCTLKKELTNLDRKFKQGSRKNLQNQNENGQLKRDKSNLEKENEYLKISVETFEKEKKYLKSKIIDLHSQINGLKNSTLDTSTRRIIMESPAPLQPDPDAAYVDLSLIESPTVAERVKEIEDSNSPYLSVKPNPTMSSLLNAKIVDIKSIQKNPKANKGFSFSSYQNMPSMSMMKEKSDYSYNGFGGHSKVDEYPSPKKTGSSTLKRPKSHTSLPSNKFRKLTQNNKLSFQDLSKKSSS